MYRFASYNLAKTYLESLTITVGPKYTISIPNRIASNDRAYLTYEGREIGYISTPHDILPDEDWVVEIGFHERRMLPEALIVEIYGNVNPEIGWTNRHFFVDRNSFSRIIYGKSLEYSTEAKGPESSFRFHIDPSVGLKMLKEDDNTAYLSLDLSLLAQKLRYAYGDLLADHPNLPASRTALSSLDPTGAPEKKSVISFDDNYEIKWIRGVDFLEGLVAPDSRKLNGINGSEYALKSNMPTIIQALVSNNTEDGITVDVDSEGKLHFDVDDFQITLTGDLEGVGYCYNLNNVSIPTRIRRFSQLSKDEVYNTASTHSLVWDRGVVNITVTENITLSFQCDASFFTELTLVINPTTKVITWGPNILFKTSPTLSSTQKSIIKFYFDGTNYYGAQMF